MWLSSSQNYFYQNWRKKNSEDVIFLRHDVGDENKFLQLWSFSLERNQGSFRQLNLTAKRCFFIWVSKRGWWIVLQSLCWTVYSLGQEFMSLPLKLWLHEAYLQGILCLFWNYDCIFEKWGCYFANWMNPCWLSIKLALFIVWFSLSISLSF